MRILYVTQYFPPEIGGGASRAREMVRYLSAQHHKVTVLTAFPNYFTGVLPSGYRGKLVVRERFGEATVIRVWTSTYRHRSVVWRLLSYVTFMFIATLVGLLGDEKYDLVYASSPPPFVGLAAWMVALWKAKKFIFEVRDVWSKAALDAGPLRYRYAVIMVQALESFCYARARLIVAVTKGCMNEVLDRGVPDPKVRLIKNGVNVDLYRPTRDAETRKKLGYKGEDLAVVYAGLLGHMQAPSVMLRAAQSLAPRGSVEFLLIGEGIEKDQLQMHAAERGIKNVTFLPGLPENEVATYLASCDVGIATLRRAEYSEGCIPTKIFAYMACGLPVIVAARGEAKDIVEKAGGGIVVDPEDSEQLAKAISHMQRRRDLAREMGQKGRQFVLKYYSRKEQAKKLERALLGLLS